MNWFVIPISLEVGEGFSKCPTLIASLKMSFGFSVGVLTL